jgi:hypothetical protein
MDTATAGLPEQARKAIRAYIGWLLANFDRARNAGLPAPQVADIRNIHEQRVRAVRVRR